MNNWTITGKLGRDCNVNDVNGSKVCNFVVAVKSGFGDKQQTLWVDCAIWGKKAESRLPEFLRKGQQVAVSGEVGTREYEKDGVKNTVLTLRVIDIDLVGGNSSQGQAPQQQQYQQQPQQYQGGVQQNNPNLQSAPQQGPSFDDFEDIPF